ncbi:MAG: flagellar biosynthesis anti-sigma factor FlgM [Planctomycetaceae bacterium]|nr:flagellar biosynthesis anti-sigma factor FlgM [Planctomycetaceae bacterium]
MQIPSTGDGSPSGPIQHVHSGHVRKGLGTHSQERSSSNEVGGVELVGGHAKQIQSLVSKLRDIPASRDEVVETVRGRLEQGEYTTRHAAERTAARILGSDAIT